MRILFALRVVFDTECVACLHPRNENFFFFPLIANVLFASIIFLAGIGFCEIFLSLWIDRVGTFELNLFAYVGWYSI